MKLLSRLANWVRTSRARSAQVRPPEPDATQKALRDAVGPRGPNVWFGRRAAWNVYDLATDSAERYEESFKDKPKD